MHPNIRVFWLFAFALTLHLCGTWILPLIDRDEARFSEASREMLQRGDLVLPTLNNVPRYDKPPLTYWCQMVFYKMFGENEFAARFHAALFTSLTALAVLGFATRLYGLRAGWCAGIAYTTTLWVMYMAKAAVADTPMVFFFTITAWAGWELLTRPTTRWWWIFYGALTFGFLAKGPVVWLPLGGILIYAWRKGIACVNGAFKFHYGLPLMLLAIGVWGIPALVETHGDFFRVGIGKHVVERSFVPMEGHGGSGTLTYFATLPLYFVLFFPCFFPWSVFTVKMIRRLKTQCGDAERYLLINIAVVFVVFTLVKTKLPHYTLPAFPLIACLLSPLLAEMSIALFTRLVLCMTAFGLAVAFVVCPFLAGWITVPIPRIQQYAFVPIRDVSASLNLAPETEFASVDYDEPSQIWYFRRWLTTWHELTYQHLVAGYMAKPGPRLCIVPVEYMPNIPVQPGWERRDFQGFDVANGKHLSLVLLLKR